MRDRSNALQIQRPNYTHNKLKSHRLQWYRECKQHSRAALLRSDADWKHSSSRVLTDSLNYLIVCIVTYLFVAADVLRQSLVILLRLLYH